MKILIAPGPYKECLSADEVANCIHDGISSVASTHKLINFPLCDGGTGFVKRLTERRNGNIRKSRVMGPLGYDIDVFYGEIKNDTAVIESSAVCGLALVPSTQRNPFLTTTYGIGQLIGEISSKGFRRIIIGMGDSSTNDGGAGALQALGVRILDEKERDIGFGGGQLLKARRIDLSKYKKPNLEEIVVACNLSSVLCGKEGTSNIYGPQKGATEKEVSILESSLENYAKLILETTGDDVRYLPGCGGSGGLATGLFSLLGAKLRYSMDIVFNETGLEDKLKDVDLLITGEGKIDNRTATGKIACGVSLLAKKYNIPSIAIVGQIGKDEEDVYYNGIDFAIPICRGPISLEESLKEAKKYLFETGQRVARILPFLQNKGKGESFTGDRGHPKGSISTLLFDLGKTLVYIPTEYDMDANIAKEFNYEEEYVESAIYSLCKSRKGLSTEEFIYELSKKLGKSRKKIEDICLAEINGAVIEDDTFDTLNNFRQRGYKTILVSNTPPTTERIIKRFNLGNYFDYVVLSCDTGYLKPDPRIFQIAINQAKVTPEETCVIGDKIRTDILGGKILGTKTVLLDKRLAHSINSDNRIPTDAIINRLGTLKEVPFLR